MLTANIKFKNFLLKNNNLKIKKNLKLLLKQKSTVLESLTPNYKYSFKKRLILKFNKFKIVKLIGMGGSILGTEAIYDFLKHKIKKKFIFFNNLELNLNILKEKKDSINLIISKSGNTLETIANANILIKKDDKNIFVTENNKNYLRILASKIKAEIVDHNNFIGGRYSVLSEVGMLPAELMGLDVKKFKQLNNLIKNRSFINCFKRNTSKTFTTH